MTNTKKNPSRFYCKKETKQGYDKKTYPKLVLNRLKVMRNSSSIYIPWALNSRKFLKEFPIYIWPMFTYLCPCAPMNEL